MMNATIISDATAMQSQTDLQSLPADIISPPKKPNIVKCREIVEDDLETVIEVLTAGFSVTRDYWVRAIKTLKAHPTPADFPRYGYVLDHNGVIVGVLLLISTSMMINGQVRNRTNCSSWYVDPAYRMYAHILSQRATRRADTTYFNTTPAPHTWRILELQGFERFANGRMITIPSLCRSAFTAKVRSFTPTRCWNLPTAEIDLLQYHQDHDCISLVCTYQGEQYPFVFWRQYRYKLLPIAHLVYCRNADDFVRFAGAVGRFLILHGFAVVVMDAEQPIRKLVGKYFGNRPRYRKGGDEIRPGNVAYSEQVLFGA